MVDPTLKIIKPLSELPPLEIRVFKITTDTVFDWFKKERKICLGYQLHNHTGGTFNYQINEEDIIDLKSLEEKVDNVLIYRMAITNVSDADLIVKLASINELKAFGALRNA